MLGYHRSVRVPIVVALALAFLASPRAAESVQSSASLSLIPSSSGPLVDGQEIEVAVLVNNTSTDTPSVVLGDGIAPVPATLTGPVTVSFGCQDCTCAANGDGRLDFVPGPVAGCVTAAPGVLGCSAGAGNTAIITLDAAGVVVPAAATEVLATIRLRVDLSTNPIVTPLILRATTEPCAVRACSSNAPATLCSDCDAAGCSLVFFQANVTPPMDCPHPCPSRVRFLGDASRPDFFEFHGIIDLAGVDPGSEPFTVTLSNALFQPIFSFTLPAGSLGAQGPNFFYRDPGARQTGGISFVKLGLRDGTSSLYRIDVQASAEMEAEATVPVMTVDLTLGTAFSTTNTWEQKPFGWQLDQIAGP